MSTTGNPVYLDARLLAHVDELANKAGVDRDEYVNDALRRYIAGPDLVALHQRVSGRADVDFDDALKLVYAQRDESRPDVRAPQQATATKAVP